jgi:hypothetical protein
VLGRPDEKKTGKEAEFEKKGGKVGKIRSFFLIAATIFQDSCARVGHRPHLLRMRRELGRLAPGIWIVKPSANDEARDIYRVPHKPHDV